MAIESIGELIPTKIPGYSDSADIQAALRAYHYGSYDFNINETNPSNLVSPSIAYTINDLQNQINSIDTIGTAILAAKGSIISASSTSTPIALSVGSNGQVLTANSGTASGLQWSSPEVTLSNSATLSNKTMSGNSNTFSNIPNSSLTYSSIEINGSPVSLGDSITIVTDPMPQILLFMGS